MAKKKSASSSSDSSPDPPPYDAASTAKAQNDLDNNAAPPSSSSGSMKGIDLSRYRQPALVEALDRLTSFTYAGSLLLKPAMKIMWRSALYQDGEVRMQELLGSLTGTAPVTEPPTPSGGKAPKKKATPSRSITDRIFHFFFVGIPMAVLVGLAYGVVNFFTCIWKDITTVTSLSQNLFTSAKSDLSYYMQHPESRPTKDEAVNAWAGQIIQPYTQAIVKRKLGPFGIGWVSGPISNAVQLLIKRAASISASEVQTYAKKLKGFDVFRPEGAELSANAREVQ